MSQRQYFQGIIRTPLSNRLRERTLGTRLGSTFHSFGTAITLKRGHQWFSNKLNWDGATKHLSSRGADYSALASQRIDGHRDTSAMQNFKR